MATIHTLPRRPAAAPDDKDSVMQQMKAILAEAMPEPQPAQVQREAVADVLQALAALLRA